MLKAGVAATLGTGWEGDASARYREAPRGLSATAELLVLPYVTSIDAWRMSVSGTFSPEMVRELRRYADSLQSVQRAIAIPRKFYGR